MYSRILKRTGTSWTQVIPFKRRSGSSWVNPDVQYRADNGSWYTMADSSSTTKTRYITLTPLKLEQVQDGWEYVAEPPGSENYVPRPVYVSRYVKIPDTREVTLNHVGYYDRYTFDEQTLRTLTAGSTITTVALSFVCTQLTDVSEYTVACEDDHIKTATPTLGLNTITMYKHSTANQYLYRRITISLPSTIASSQMSYNTVRLRITITK